MPTHFEKAFKSAREKGLAQFHYEDKPYTTQYQGESPLLQVPLTARIQHEKADDPSIKLVDQYNTGLKPDEYKQFADWAKQRYGSHDDILYEMGSYDLQGAWKDIRDKKIDFDPETGHLPDTYKKPNHITFSDQSRYADKDNLGGKWEQNGDRWKFYPSTTTIQTYGLPYLQKYFRDKEKETDLIWDNPVVK